MQVLCTLQGPSLKRPVAVGKEAFGLYILDKKLVNEVSDYFPKRSLSSGKMFGIDKHYKMSCNQASKELSNDISHKRLDMHL